MKKTIIILFLIMILWLVGCNEPNTPEISKLNILSSTTKIEILKDFNKENDIQYQDKIVITNLNDLKLLIENLNSLELQECDFDNYEYKQAKYYIISGTKKIYIINDDTLYVQENGNKKYTIKQGNYDFLNSYFTNRQYRFTDFDFTGDIVIKKIDISKEAEVTDGSSFYENLNAIVFVKTTENVEHFEYIITIGNDTIQVANQYFNFQNQIYEVVEGNFEFLKNYNFNSSGWLPWV